MNICVLCLEQKELTKEHIVPDCVGGGLVEEILCKDCNSTLGHDIDGAYSKSILVQLPRLAHQIAGKSGSIPNPFSRGGSTTDGDQQLRVQIRDGFKPYIVPSVHEEVSENGLAIRITIDKEDESDIDSILAKKLNRYYKGQGVGEAKITQLVSQRIAEAKAASVSVSNNPMIEYKFAENISDLILEYIKITYEIAAIECGEEYVLNSEVALLLRTALKNRSKEKIHGSFGVDLGPIKALYPADDKHYVILMNNACQLSIFGMAAVIEFCAPTEKFAKSEEDAVIYIFDPVAQSYQRLDFCQYLYEKSR